MEITPGGMLSILTLLPPGVYFSCGGRHMRTVPADAGGSYANEVGSVPYDRSVKLKAPYEETVQAVRQALADQGFGVLTEIDVQATLKTKLDHDMEPYLILGACNPPLAHQALEVDRSIGLLLPCNVVIRGEGDHVVVQAIDPDTMVALTGLDAMAPVADEAGRRLDAALASLKETHA